MCENSHCHCEQWFDFSCSFFQYLQRNCCVPLRIDRATMLQWNSRHMTSFAEETGHHLLRSDFSTNNFCWIWLVLENIHGGLLLICTDPWFVTCDDLIIVFWGITIVFFQHFFTPIDTNLFLSVCHIVRHPTRTNPFYHQAFMQYWMWPKIAIIDWKERTKQE